jgi:NAD(P)-dependent dehydrogenase (short-subunit alcohol dehydrogenase family)
MQSSSKFAGLGGASVLVTGGATGIGSAIVENFVCQGSRVVFLDINADAAAKLVAQLGPGAKITPEFVYADLMDGQCLKRFVEPEDVATLVAFLASDEVRSCTNQTFVIDAGWL